jgi:hypothetical protein
MGWERTIGNNTWVFGFNRKKNVNQRDINCSWVVSNFLNCVATFIPPNEASHHKFIQISTKFGILHLNGQFNSHQGTALAEVEINLVAIFLVTISVDKYNYHHCLPQRTKDE